MLKKSLKTGSILVLLFSLLFFIGCSNGTTDTDPDSGGPVPPVGPETPDPQVTKVTILPGNIELGRGESYTFTADVEGVGAFSSTVVWSLDPPEEGEESRITTAINSTTGKLTLDPSLHVGRELVIRATAGGKTGIAVVTVAPEGPYFTWVPGKVIPDIAQPDAVAYGYLRGYSYEDKDIRLRTTNLLEGVDYTIATENGVTGIRGTGAADPLIVVGTRDPYEGVRVMLDTSLITLTDPTKTGIVRITMLPGAFEGADKAELKPGRTSLVFEVSDYRAIDSLGNLDILFHDSDPALDKPMQGAAAPKGTHSVANAILDNAFTGFSTGSVSWNHLSYRGNFEKEANADLVATVILTANNLHFFKETLSEADVVAAFKKGKPVASKPELSNNGRTITFTLTYDLYSLVLGETVAGDVDVSLGSTPLDLVEDFPAPPTHSEDLPPVKWGVNDYYEVDWKWSGDGVSVSGADGKTGTFSAARLPALKKAVATITLTPKIGYTFEGTDIVSGSFTASFVTSSPVADPVITRGAEGSLVLTLTYDVEEKVISIDDIKPGNFAKLIARPIHGKSVEVTGAFPLNDPDTSPYTGSVVWTPAVGGPARLGQFTVGDAANPVATITLAAKTGYVFEAAGYSSDGAAFGEAVAIDAPVPVAGTFLSPLTGGNEYKPTVVITYDISSHDIFQQITKLDGIASDFNPVAGETYGGTITVAVPGVEFSTGASAGEVVSGLTGGATGGFQFGVPVKVEYVLEPSAGYSFSSTAGSLSYFEDEDKLPEIVAYLRDHTDIYKGSKIPLASRVSLDDIYLLGGNLVLTAAYTVKPAQITSADFSTNGEVGDLSAVPLKDASLPVFTPGTNLKYATSIAWYKQGEEDEEDALDKDAKFAASTVYVAKITLTPNTGYTFAGSNEGTNLTAIETALEDDDVYGGTDSNGSTVINLAATAIGVKGFATQDVLSPTDDKIVITLTFLATAL